MASLKELLIKNRYITKIDGTYYDVTDYLPHHPGGEVIRGVCNGNDGSAMFHSSHFITPKIESYPSIKKIQIKEDDVIDVKARKAAPDKFLESLKQEVYTYLKKNNIKYQSPSLTGKIVLYGLLTLFSILFYLGYVKGNFLCCILMGFITWNFTGTIVHDHGMHRFIAGRKNKTGELIWSTIQMIVFPFTFDEYVLTSHAGHHSGVHNKELDADDWLLYPMVRLSKHHPHRWWHSYQHLYWPIGYSLYLIFYVQKSLSTDKAVNWWRRHSHSYKAHRSNKYNFLYFIMVFFHIILPVYCLGLIGIVHYLAFFLTYSFGGVFFSTVSHNIIDLESIKKNDNNLWSYETVAQSGDFLTDSFFAYLITGGFNVHGIHHLLPSIHPSHLHKIYHIYKRKCKEFNYPLTQVDTWTELFQKFHQFLKEMGKK